MTSYDEASDVIHITAYKNISDVIKDEEPSYPQSPPSGD